MLTAVCTVDLIWSSGVLWVYSYANELALHIKETSHEAFVNPVRKFVIVCESLCVSVCVLYNVIVCVRMCVCSL